MTKKQFYYQKISLGETLKQDTYAIIEVCFERKYVIINLQCPPENKNDCPPNPIKITPTNHLHFFSLNSFQ